MTSFSILAWPFKIHMTLHNSWAEFMVQLNPNTDTSYKVGIKKCFLCPMQFVLSTCMLYCSHYHNSLLAWLHYFRKWNKTCTVSYTSCLPSTAVKCFLRGLTPYLCFCHVSNILIPFDTLHHLKTIPVNDLSLSVSRHHQDRIARHAVLQGFDQVAVKRNHC